MKKLLIILLFFTISIILKAQDTPSVYKVHFITSSDLRYEAHQLEGVFVFGNDTNRRELRFKNSLQFEEYIYYGIDSLVASTGTYGYDPGGWLILKGTNRKDRRFALLSFYKFMFIATEYNVQKFKVDFEIAVGRYKYSALKSFEPDPMLFKACKNLSNNHFVMQKSDP